MKKYINKLVSLGLVFALLISTVLWLSSYTHHSAIGIDHDYKQQGKILHVFYRMNWTGHGSLWLGYGSAWREADSTKPLESFDPASALFKRVDKPLASSASFWNRIGFWYIHAAQPKPVFWLGVPSGLLVFVLALLVYFNNNYPPNKQ